jgi:3-oxoacyl-[acyl-carrier protein] reductase
MDLGIRGRTALVCAASKGLGKGCAVSLAKEGVNLVITARGAEALEASASEIKSAYKVNVIAVAGDITTPEGRAAALKACPSPDILVNNAGGPPPGDFRAWSREDWIKALDANMLTPIELMKAVVDGMIARRFGRIINITSGAVKNPIPELGLSNGARTGLTGFVAGLSRQTVRHNVTINGLLPGPFDTDRLRANFEFNAKKMGKTPAELAKSRAEANPAGRFGTIEEFGDACAYLCSAQAGFVTGQNFLMDGGAFPGTF